MRTIFQRLIATKNILFNIFVRNVHKNLVLLSTFRTFVTQLINSQKLKVMSIKTEKLNIRCSTELYNKMNSIKDSANEQSPNGKTTLSDVVKYAFDFQELRIEPKGTVLVEITLKKWLFIGHEAPINATELRRFTGVRLDSVNAVMTAYEQEIKEFNQRFNNK